MLDTVELNIGDVIDNNKLTQIFQCGNMGGMRISSKNKTLVLISDHTNTLYEDVWRNNTLFYTGQGTIGDQKLSGANKTLYDSALNDYTIVLFEVFETGNYVYKGPVVLIGQPYMEEQKDINGNQRFVWIFPLHLMKDGNMKGLKNQLRIKKLTIENIRNFKKVHEFDFSTAEFINTISGKNGAGKSTVFECVSICQKAYYIWKYYYPTKRSDELSEKYNQILNKDIDSIASNKHSSIELVLSLCFDHNDNESETNDELLLTITFSFSSNSHEWHLTISPEDDAILQRYWNEYNPTNVIVLLDADKMVDEEDFSFQKINMVSENTSEVIDFIMDPKKTYQNLYNIAMNSYVHNRLVPSKNRKDIFTVDSKKMFAEIMANHSITMGNFSGQQKKDQFVLIANRDGKYDMRQMSSGEKLIWYILLLFNYIKSISVLIIDEPENHLHEQLSWALVKYLLDINKERKNGVAIEQVFLLTHAKNLIYNNFSKGSNYLLDNNNSLQIIDRENCEDILRSCGISYTDDKVLYVEGDTEITLLGELCSENNIKVRQLANCGEIIRVFSSLSKVKDLVYVPRFVFLIDRDTRDDSEIELLKSKNTTFFNEHFAVLPCHEIENFYLDEVIISEVYNNLMHLADPEFKKDITNEEILEVIRKKADGALSNTKKKYLNYRLDELAQGFNKLIHLKKIRSDTKVEFDTYIDDLFTSNEFNDRILMLKNTYDDMSEKYSESKWKKDWKVLCDGKTVYTQTVTELSVRSKIPWAWLDKHIRSAIRKDKNSSFNKWWSGVESMFN